MQLTVHSVRSASAEIWYLAEGASVLRINLEGAEPVTVSVHGTETDLLAVCKAIGKADVTVRQPGPLTPAEQAEEAEVRS